MTTISFDPWGKGDESPTYAEEAIDADERHRGQVRMAYRLADRYSGRLMHVHGLGWHWWDSQRWRQDDTGRATRAVLDTLKRALSESVGGDKALRSDASKCESDAGIRGVLAIAAALEPFAVTVADLDADPYLLNVANGTVDLRTGELREHDPVDRITKITRAAYRPGIQSTTWEAFLSRVLPDEDVRAYLQRFVGMALLGTVRDHCLAILTGTGRNGKGVFYGALNGALGDYGGTADPDLFMHRDAAHPTGEMDLLGMRLVVVSESDKNRRLAEATVKRLTGGDEIKARRMRQDFVSFTPSHTAMLVTNHLPRVSGDDPALWARLRVIPFDVVIPAAEQDRQLPERLKLEADAILTWALEGWRDYQEDGLDEPAAVLRATGNYKAESDAVGRFIEAECMVNPHMQASVAELWSRWCKWRAEEGAEEIGKRVFSEALDKRGFEQARTNSARIRRGIGLQDAESSNWS